MNIMNVNRFMNLYEYEWIFDMIHWIWISAAKIHESAKINESPKINGSVYNNVWHCNTD